MSPLSHPHSLLALRRELGNPGASGDQSRRFGPRARQCANSANQKEISNASQVADMMATDVAAVDPHATLQEAARLMRDKDIGDVIVTDGSAPRGILTDRDIAIRAVADSRDPAATEAGEIASTNLQTLSPSDSIDDADALMRDAALRR